METTYLSATHVLIIVGFKIRISIIIIFSH